MVRLVQETTLCNGHQHKVHQDFHTQRHPQHIGGNPQCIIILSMWQDLWLAQTEVADGRGSHNLAVGA